MKIKQSTRAIGQRAEAMAVKFLKKQKLKILHKNYQNKIGEIDIIAFDKKEDCIVFVEVKSKNTDFFGLPREMVDERKQFKIEQVATSYLMTTNQYQKKIRFDVVEVLDKQITHIKQAW